MKKTFFYFALIFLVLELTYLNSKSLIFLTEDHDIIGKVFSVIGATMFAMITVLVMRTSGIKWAKYVFPLFDALLFFCALNLHFSDNLLANPIRFSLTIFFALFTGMITYSLGIININQDHSETEIESLKSEVLSSESEIKSLQSELSARQTEIGSLNSNIKDRETEISKYRTECNSLKDQIKHLESDLMRYRESHRRNERSRILKKKESNRTPEELQLLEEVERII